MSSILELQKTPGGFKVFTANTIEDLLLFSQISQDTFVFRGQADSNWELETRVERNVPDSYKRNIGLESLERKMLERFSRRAHHYLQPTDIPQSDLEWLALIQHYGGPTRLLDFTRSIFIAAYFAVNPYHKFDASAIWAVNTRFLFENLHALLSRDWPKIEFVLNKYQIHNVDFGDPEWLPAIFNRELRINCAFLSDPFRQNRRLMAQQGVFIIPLDVSQPFLANLAAVFDPTPDFYTSDSTAMEITEKTNIDDCAVIKLVISKDAYFSMRKALRRMNIITETMFPDLDGEARSLADMITGEVHLSDMDDT